MRLNEARLRELEVEDPALHAEMLQALADLDELRESDPLQFYHPAGVKHREFHGARTRIKAFLGGNQSGKSTTSIVDDLIQAVDRDCLAERLRPFKKFEPPFYCRIITPDFTETMEGVVFEKIREWCPKYQYLGGSFDEAFNKQLRKLRFANGSWFDFLTFEQDLDKFGGVTLDRVHFDEEPPGEKGRRIFHQALVRIMKRSGDVVFSMTPELGMTWMFDDIYEKRDDPDVTVLVVETDENPHLPAEQVEKTFAFMSDEEQEAKRKGRFVHFGGLVVDLDDGRHVVDGVSPGHVRSLTNYVVIDPGVQRGAVLFAGFDKDNVMLCYDELYPSGREETLVANLAAAIRDKLAFWGLSTDEVAFLIDPSARNRTVDGGEGVEAAFFAAGIYPGRAKNDRFASVMQLRRRAAADPPGLLITRQCVNLRWELRRWRVAEDERQAEQRPQRGQGRDSFATIGPDHLADCARYLALEWMWGPPLDPQERPYGQRVWTPGTAPSQRWFTGAREAPPMGSMS